MNYFQDFVLESKTKNNFIEIIESYGIMLLVFLWRINMKKLITVLLAVIIPLLSAFAIGIYGYKRYQSSYIYVGEIKGYFDTRLEENNTESQIKAYLDYYSTYYKEVVAESVKNEAGTQLFTVKGYAVLSVTYNDDGEEKARTLTYQFFVFDIDYEFFIPLRK